MVEHVFVWCFEGENVEICAEFNQWQGEAMQRFVPSQPIKTQFLDEAMVGALIGAKTPTHYFVKLIEPRRYEYKFRVDGRWKFAPDQEITHDQRGNQNNVVNLADC
mmetsp:Transcript_1040/g.1901  ORF Transcript_1040/g.1901 Transcript_1040/m.1901 type:complete len:106 (+) Transcript_1040:1035-1352(+)